MKNAGPNYQEFTFSRPVKIISENWLNPVLKGSASFNKTPLGADIGFAPLTSKWTVVSKITSQNRRLALNRLSHCRNTQSHRNYHEIKRIEFKFSSSYLRSD